MFYHQSLRGWVHQHRELALIPGSLKAGCSMSGDRIPHPREKAEERVQVT